MDQGDVGELRKNYDEI